MELSERTDKLDDKLDRVLTLLANQHSTDRDGMTSERKRGRGQSQRANLGAKEVSL